MRERCLRKVILFQADGPDRTATTSTEDDRAKHYPQRRVDTINVVACHQERLNEEDDHVVQRV